VPGAASPGIATHHQIAPPPKRSHSTKQNQSRRGGLCSHLGKRAPDHDRRQRLHPSLRRQGRHAGSITQPHPARRGVDHRGFRVPVRSRDCGLSIQSPSRETARGEFPDPSLNTFREKTAAAKVGVAAKRGRRCGWHRGGHAAEIALLVV